MLLAIHKEKIYVNLSEVCKDYEDVAYWKIV